MLFALFALFALSAVSAVSVGTFMVPFLYGVAARSYLTNHNPELAERQMRLLKELLPGLKRVAILSDPTIPGADASGLAPIERAHVAAALAAGLAPQLLKVKGPKPDLEGAFVAMANEGAEALVVLEVPAVFNIARLVAEMAAAKHLPMKVWGGQGESGALISYGTSFMATYPRVAVMVERILNGAAPSETVFEVVARRELVINTQTAHALGVSVPAGLLAHADRVIE